MAASRPVRHGDSMVPAAQEQHIPDLRPGGSNDTCGWWQMSSTAAEFSGSVSSCHRTFARWQGSSPYCIRTDLVHDQKETGFRKQSASFFEVLLLQGIPALRFVGTVVISSEIRRKRTNVSRGRLFRVYLDKVREMYGSR